MSDLRVALIAEGPTDAFIVEAALKALLPRPFVLSLLQPEATQPRMGSGWGGVLRWCQSFAQRGHANLASDPTLAGFDLFILHADADLSHHSYTDISQDIAARAKELSWAPLPSVHPCPPAQKSADAVRACLLSWAGLQAPGPKTVLCVPSKAMDAWLASAVLPPEHPFHQGLECHLNLSAQMARLPKASRIQKSNREYRKAGAQITAKWLDVRRHCTQADRFSSDVGRALT